MVKNDLVVGIVAPVGTAVEQFVKRMKGMFYALRYGSTVVSLSDIIVEQMSISVPNTESGRLNALMDAGNKLRQRSANNDFLALAAISKMKEEVRDGNHVCILRTLKTKEEVNRLRRVYGNAFFLIGLVAT